MSLIDDNDGDRRFAERVPYASLVTVIRDRHAWLAEVQDMSHGGCGIFRPPQCSLEEADVVQLVFHEGPGLAVVVGARVARVETGGIGFEYHEEQAIPPQPPL